VAGHERLGVVEQDLARHPAEVPEGQLQPVEPGVLALVAEGGDEEAPGVARRGHGQVDPHRLAADLGGGGGGAEASLEPVAGRGLEAERRARLGRQLAPHPADGALDRAQADREAVLGQQLLADHVGVAAVTPQALAGPRPQAVQGAPSPRRRGGARPPRRR
jgi:hypothetical protein